MCAALLAAVPAAAQQRAELRPAYVRACDDGSAPVASEDGTDFYACGMRFDAASGRLEAPSPSLADRAPIVASTQAGLLRIGHGGTTLELLDRDVVRSSVPAARVVRVAVSPMGTRLATIEGRERQLRVRELPSLRVVQEIDVSWCSRGASIVGFTALGELLATCSTEHGVALQAVDALGQLDRSPFLPVKCDRAALSRSGDVLACATGDVVSVIDVASSDVLGTTPYDKRISRIAVSDGGHGLAFVGHTGQGDEAILDVRARHGLSFRTVQRGPADSPSHLGFIGSRLFVTGSREFLAFDLRERRFASASSRVRLPRAPEGFTTAVVDRGFVPVPEAMPRPVPSGFLAAYVDPATYATLEYRETDARELTRYRTAGGFGWAIAERYYPEALRRSTSLRTGRDAAGRRFVELSFDTREGRARARHVRVTESGPALIHASVALPRGDDPRRYTHALTLP